MKRFLAFFCLIALLVAQTIPHASNVGLLQGNAVLTRLTDGGGSAVKTLVKLNSSGAAVPTIISDTTAFGIVVVDNGSTVDVAVSGQTLCTFENATTGGNYVVNGTSVATNCRDAGATYPTGSQPIGRIVGAGGAAGDYTVALFGPGSTFGGGGGMSGASQRMFFPTGHCDAAGNAFVTTFTKPQSGLAPACSGGTFVAYASMSASALQVFTTRWVFPSGLVGDISATFFASPSVTNTNTAVHYLRTACLGNGEDWAANPTFNTAQRTNTAWSVSATQYQFQTIAALDLTGCAANEQFIIEWGRDGASTTPNDNDTNVSSLTGLLLQWAVNQ